MYIAEEKTLHYVIQHWNEYHCWHVPTIMHYEFILKWLNLNFYTELIV